MPHRLHGQCPFTSVIHTRRLQPQQFCCIWDNIPRHSCTIRLPHLFGWLFVNKGSQLQAQRVVVNHPVCGDLANNIGKLTVVHTHATAKGNRCISEYHLGATGVRQDHAGSAILHDSEQSPAVQDTSTVHTVPFVKINITTLGVQYIPSMARYGLDVFPAGSPKTCSHKN